MRIESFNILILLFTFQLVSCQSLKVNQFGFIEETIKAKDDTISFYLYGSKETIETKKPLLIFLQGSGASPIFRIKPDGSVLSSLILHPKMVENIFHYVVIGKPGFQFADSIGVKPNVHYHKKMSHNYRVETANRVINHLVNKKFIDTSKIMLVGHSEGGQITPQIAYINKNVTHIASESVSKK